MKKFFYFIRYFIIFLSFLSIACNGQKSTKAQDNKISYDPPDTSTATLEQFTDADWLYDNYFGEYDLPEEFREEVMPELKMVANGFALRHAQNTNPYQSFAFFDLFAEQMFDSSFAQRMEEQSLSENSSLPAIAVEGPPINPEEINEVINPEFQKYIEEQDKLIEDYHLPYALPGYPKKIIDIEQMFLSATKCVDFGTGKCKNLNSTPQKTPTSPFYWGPYNHSEPRSWPWQTADMIMGHEPFVGSFNSSPQGYWNHIGLTTYLSGRSGVSIVDAMPAGSGRPGRKGVDFGDWTQFLQSYRTVGGYTINQISFYAKGRERIANYAIGLIGKPYNLNSLKGESRSRGTYCSLLVWESFYMTLGFDLDADGGLFVFPDDISRSRAVYNFHNSYSPYNF